MLASETDAEVTRRVAAGGDGARAAEAELCRRFAPRIRLYGLRHLHGEDRARDLVQAVLLAVLEAARAGRVAEAEHMDRYVLGTCRNVAARVREVDQRAMPTDPLDLDLGAVEPEVGAVDAGALAPCLAGLDERSRNVVMLAFHDERSAGEIAALIGTTAGNVRVLRHRAVAQLRRCIDGQREVRA